MRRMLTLALPLALAAVLGAAPVQAKGYDHISAHNVNLNFCGAGFGVDVAEETDLSWISRPADAHTTYAFTVWTSGTITWTNPANGHVVTMTSRKVDRDLVVRDNGDGTRDIRAANNRNEAYVGPDGTTYRNRGPIWIDVVVSDAGTPRDPFDDYQVDFLGFTQGGNWDMDETWCDQMVTWLS